MNMIIEKIIDKLFENNGRLFKILLPVYGLVVVAIIFIIGWWLI